MQKAGLVELADDDRGLLYGVFLDLAMRLRSNDGEQVKLLFRRYGARAFASEAETAKAAQTAAPRSSSIAGDLSDAS